MPSRRNPVKTTKFLYIVSKLFRGSGISFRATAYCCCRYVSRVGEFTEVVKKIVFQGKPVNEENLFHLKRELGDIMWYVACQLVWDLIPLSMRSSK